ncbi:hypothetical protein RQP46_001503 [Phenoliferia psychrophenolica]
MAHREWASPSALPAPKRLAYSIHSSSSCTGPYRPDNILVDKPTDANSRWTSNADGHTDSGDLKTPPGTTRRGAQEVPFITLELEQPCLVTEIGFGKYKNTHPCNLQDFSIFGGMSSSKRYMEPLLHGALKNDPNKEAFPLNHSNVINDNSSKGDPMPFPIKYIRIDALCANGLNYNIAIWHVWLEGISEPSVMTQVLADYEEARSRATSHLVLAHLRRSFLLPSFDSLRSSLPLSVTTSFEHPILSKLHSSFVLKGLFNSPGGAEAILEEALDHGLLREWGNGGKKGKSVARWEKLSDGNPDVVGSAAQGPSPRGGHQMVRVGRKIVLYGGYDGRNLADMWERDLPRTAGGSDDVGPWKELHPVGWGPEGSVPAGRSCHQFAVDEAEGWIYLLGGIMDSAPTEAGAEERRSTTPIPIPSPSPAPEARPTNGNGAAPMDVEDEGLAVPISSGRSSRSSSRARDPLASDFWRYKAVGPGQGRWELLSEDTAAEGGPKLLFDHQMAIYGGAETLFVFGGKHVGARANAAVDAVDQNYSGMYSYNIRTQKWHFLFGDPTPTDPFRSERLLGRTGHAMLFDPHLHTLFILSGNRGNLYLSDLWAVKVSVASDSDDDDADAPVPEPELWRAGAVLPASIPDSPSSSPTIISTKLISADYSREGGPKPMFTQRATIDAESGEWTLLSGLTSETKERNERPVGEVWTRARSGAWECVELRGESPVGRFSSQAIYDPLRQEHFLFGGNPSPEEGTVTRLADFWRLRIQKPTPEEALRKARFLIRKQKFTEMCRTQPTLSALIYLQTTLSSVVDHTDEAEASAFRSCMAALLAAPASNNSYDDDSMADGDEDDDDSSMSASALSVRPVQPDGDQPGAALTPELFAQRHALFEELLDYFPDDERQPREDLRNMTQSRRDSQLVGRFD